MRDELSEESYEIMTEYIQNILTQVETDYSNVHLNPMHYADILYLASIAIRIHWNSEKWDEIGYNICSEIKGYVENYEDYSDNISMLSGFGYTCFAVQTYSNESGRLYKFSESLHKLFSSRVKKRAIQLQYNYNHTKSSDFDCISGISGALSYLLDYRQSKLSDEAYCDLDLFDDAILSSLDYLIGLTKQHRYNGKEVLNFHITSDQQFLESEKKSFVNGNFNFGMSHGMIAPLFSLSKAYKVGYDRQGLKAAIGLLNDFYKKFNRTIDGIVYWPGQLSYEDFENKKKNIPLHYASSWCYGNTGILSGLLLVSKNMGWEDEKYEIRHQLVMALSKPLEQMYLVSPALCHGFSSILAGKVLLAEQYGGIFTFDLGQNIEAVISLSRKNTYEAQLHPEQIENEEGRLEGYLGEYSLLNGVTGIIAVFADLMYGISDYRKIMLMG